MGLKLTVRMGGAVAATTVDYTSAVRLWELSEQGEHTPVFNAGMKCENGSSSQWEFILDDDPNDIPKADLTRNLPAHTVVTASEDGPGYDAWLSRARIAQKEAGRGEVDHGNAIFWKVTVDDANSDLKGLALTSPWVRGLETGRARVLAALAAFCNGSPRLTTVISTHLVAAGGEVSMPAKTYPAGTDLSEILNDCAEMEGKIYSVVIHHLASVSHLCFLYIDEADHTTYLSTLSITDTSPNLTTSFPPIWDQGAAKIEDGQELVSGIVSTYGADSSSYVFVQDAGDVTSYDYWVAPHNDSLSVTAAQASTRASALRESLSNEHVTHQVTIKLRANQVDLLCAGMSIPIRAAASMGGQYLNTTQTRRIAQLDWEPIAPDVGAVDGFYYAHLQLNRPVRVLARGAGLPVGPKAPSDGTAAVGATTDYHWDFESDLLDDTNTYDFIAIPYTYFENGGLRAKNLATGGFDLDVPLPPVTGGTVYDFTAILRNFGGDSIRLRVAFYTNADKSGLLQTDYIGAVTTSAPTTVTGAVTAPGVGTKYLFLRVERNTGSSNQQQVDDILVTHGGTAATPGTTGPSLGVTGSFGSADTYLPADSVIEHTNLSDLGGTHHDATQITFESTGTIAATNVQAAIAEVASESSTGSLSNTLGEKHTVSTVGATGTTETLNLANGNWHDVTLDANCTFTFTGATSGVGVEFVLILRQDGTGSRTVTWPASVAWPNAVTPTLATAANALDIFLFRTTDGGVTWFGEQLGSSAGNLDGLSDVTITAAALGNILRYNGSAWVNSAKRWAPVTTDPANNGNWVLLFTDSGDVVMSEVEG